MRKATGRTQTTPERERSALYPTLRHLSRKVVAFVELSKTAFIVHMAGSLDLGGARSEPSGG
jgi:hypothetical protein